MNNKMKLSTKIGYGLGEVGSNLIFTFAGSFLTLYYTDSVALSAAFIGTMMLFTRILDGVSDILMGILIDHTNTKLGKARPYVIFGSVLLLISFLLLFHVPASLGDTGKKIYAVVTYIFMAVICYTAVNLSYTTLITLMTPNQEERASLSSVKSFFGSLALLLINAYSPKILAAFGGGQKGFSRIAWLYGIIALICLLMAGFCGKEYHQEEKKAEKKESVPFQEAVKALFSTKYTYLCCFAFILNWLELSLNGGSMVYFARDVLGNMGAMPVISFAGTIPCLILLSFVPKVSSAIGKRKAMLIGAALNVIGFAVLSFAPRTIIFIALGCMLKGCGMAFVNTLLFVTVADFSDYIVITKKKQIAGLANSVVSFGMKVGTGFGAAILGWMLAWGGYSEQLANAFQPQSAKTVLAEMVCFAGIPMICAAATLIIIFFLDVDTKVKTYRG